MNEDALERMRAICLALPEATERLSHGEPTWFVRDKKVFAMMDTYHHNAAHLGFWCPAPEGAQRVMVESGPDRFYVPPYVGHRGWLGVRLDTDAVDWDEVGFLVEQAYRMVAPKKLVAGLGAQPLAPSPDFAGEGEDGVRA